MLKRITESYTTATIDEINEEGDYAIPTADERENPGVPWEDVVKKRDLQNAFQGDFKCNLCPKKVLRTKLFAKDFQLKNCLLKSYGSRRKERNELFQIQVNKKFDWVKLGTIF